MKAGPMREWLHILKPVTVVNEFGEKYVEYTETKRIHAERVKFAGKRSDEVGEHFPMYDVRFNIRDVHVIEENWRVQQDGGYLYDVTAIEPNVQRGFKTLICERVNE